MLTMLLLGLFPVHFAAAADAPGRLTFVPRPATPPLEMFTIKASSLVVPSRNEGYSHQHTVWDRIREHGNFFFDPDNKRISNERKRYTRTPGYLLKVTERAEPFLYYIVEQLDRAGLPLELALLPIIESAYQIDAKSKHGALGLWQFIGSTAKVYGLKKNWWYEGRKDLQASTDAAIRYFKDLSDMFDGDWLLVLAAYNAGERSVESAIKANRKRGRGTSFWDLKLPSETMSYVPRFLAVLSIIQDPQFYDVEIWPVLDTPYFTPIDTRGKVRLTSLARKYDVDPGILQRLNAGYRRKVTPPKATHTVLLPVGVSSNAETYASGGDFIRAAYTPPSGITHKVKSGDTLSMISRRYGVPVKRIKYNNELRNDRIHIGQKLYIPES
jgi:membrane-bound lytic murein transglycosylase D